MLVADLYRALRSIYFYISVFTILIVMFISISGYMTDNVDVVALLVHSFSNNGSTLFILCIAPILPYGMSFALDLEERTSPFWIIRTGTKTCATCKLLAATITGFIVVSLSIIIFSLSLWAFFP